jgi:hypothetical protein
MTSPHGQAVYANVHFTGALCKMNRSFFIETDEALCSHSE